MIEIRKALRTVQNTFPELAAAKQVVYHYSRKYLNLSHEGDFKIVDLLSKSEQDLYLDVGANRGQSILSIRAHRRDARIVSFEPNPLIYEATKKRFAGDPLLTLENYGLGTAEGTLTLYIPSYRGLVYDGNASCSKEVAFNYLGSQTLYFFNPTHVEIVEQRCAIKTLDSLRLAPSFIKIDVEGLEYEVAAGGVDTLRRHEPVMMFERQYCDERIFALLGELGYEHVALDGAKLVKADRGGLNAIMMTPARWRDRA